MLFSFEIYKTDIYPGVVNHLHTSYGYGIFSLNVMEGESETLKISRKLISNNSLTIFEYAYNSEGLLTSFNEMFQIDDGEFKKSGNYNYEYQKGKLSSVRENEKEIFFPTTNNRNEIYFLTIKGKSDELLFNYEYNQDGEVISIILNDQNGTQYFFKDKLLKSIESIGTATQRLSALYNYSENNQLERYRFEYTDGAGVYRQRTRYDFAYDEKGIISKYFFEKSGQGQDYQRVLCTFESIYNEDGTLNTTYALDDNEETVRTARYTYENNSNYTVNIFDEENQLIVIYTIEQK
jgi:hypothetical protein